MFQTKALCVSCDGRGQSHNALMIGETDEATRVAWDFINQFAPLHHVSPGDCLARRPHTDLGGCREDHWIRSMPTRRARFCVAADWSWASGLFIRPETFRLRFLRGDRLHYRFWGQMLRWLWRLICLRDRS